jgi:hypothetical protein
MDTGSKRWRCYCSKVKCNRCGRVRHFLFTVWLDSKEEENKRVLSIGDERWCVRCIFELERMIEI